MGQHGPVNHSHESGRGPKLLHHLVAETRLHRFPVGVLHRSQLAEHNFPVIELEGGRLCRLSKGVNLGPFSKFGKNGVELWIATHSHVLHGSAEGGHGESHQRSIPTNLLHRRYHFEISALTRGLA